MTTLDEARAVIDRFSGRFKPKQTQLFGVLGNGSGIVTGTRSNNVFVRIGSSPPVEIFNMRVPPINDLPVAIGYDQNPSLMEVLDVDKTRVTDWLNYAYVPPHAHSHTYGDEASGYPDIIYLQKRQFIPLMCIPTTPPSMVVKVLSDYYPYGVSWKYFSGANSANLSSYRPGTGNARFVTIYIDATSNTLGYISGSAYSLAFPPDEVRDYIPVPPEGSIPVAAILLTGSGESRIVESDIYDVRLIYNSLGGTSTPTYASSSLNPETLDPTRSAQPGTSSYPARLDHRHAINLYGSGIPSGIAYGPRKGISPWAAREDHTHHLTSGIIPTWAIADQAITSAKIATEAIYPYHIGSGVIKQYHLDSSISLGSSSGTSSAGGHLHGLARWSVYSGLATVDLPDYAEYLESISNLGYELDPINFVLTASGDKIQFNPPFSGSGIVVAHYVIAQL